MSDGLLAGIINSLCCAVERHPFIELGLILNSSGEERRDFGVALRHLDFLVSDKDCVGDFAILTRLLP